MRRNRIYRFMSFENFVDMIQTQSLAFVHPTMWDDPLELEAFEKMLSEKEEVEGLIFLCQKYKVYAQSWTRLEESDAMWRIYNNNGMSIRISIKKDSIPLLEGVELKNVLYTNDIDRELKKIDLKESYDQLFAIKRKVFQHEQEVRLIKHYRFKDIEDAKNHVYAFLFMFNENYRKAILDNYKIEELEQRVKESVELTNVNLANKVEKINYSHIPNFIQDVMLSPFAPSWFEDTVKRYCEINNIKFIGKSKLYLNSQ